MACASSSPSSPSSSSSVITFTHKLLQNEKETATELSHNFGISTIKVGTTELLNKKYHIVITFDRSGSMSYVMGEVKHTIKNMLNYLCEVECDICITIMFFDNELNILEKNIHLTDETKNEMMVQIEKLDSRGMTNFEKPFQKITELYMDDMQNIHIFMTDGNPNEGKTTTDQLYDILDKRYEHNFMGFGVGHNEQMLYALTEKTNGNYYFIDSIENAGMIYGEVLNKILYRRFENITYSTDEKNAIEFYNYKTNEWSNTYVVGSAGSEDTFTTHFRFLWDIPYESLPLTFNVTYNDLISSTTTPIIHTSNITEQEYHPNVEIPADMRNVDVEKYYYRQLVLEKMFVVNKTNNQTTSQSMSLLQTNSTTPTTNHSDKIETLFNKIKTFMEVKELTEDLFMKQLLDDLSILFRSQRNPTMSAYGLARHIGQGAQRAYNVVNMAPQNIQNQMNISPSVYQTQNQNCFPSMPLQSMNSIDPQQYMQTNQVAWGGGSSRRSRGLMQQTSLNFTENELNDDATLDPTSYSDAKPTSQILQHTLSQEATSVYTSPHRTKIMKKVSGRK